MYYEKFDGFIWRRFPPFPPLIFLLPLFPLLVPSFSYIFDLLCLLSRSVVSYGIGQDKGAGNWERPHRQGPYAIYSWAGPGTQNHRENTYTHIQNNREYTVDPSPY
jgi:hypothetical protein